MIFVLCCLFHQVVCLVCAFVYADCLSRFTNLSRLIIYVCMYILVQSGAVMYYSLLTEYFVPSVNTTYSRSDMIRIANFVLFCSWLWSRSNYFILNDQSIAPHFAFVFYVLTLLHLVMSVSETGWWREKARIFSLNKTVCFVMEQWQQPTQSWMRVANRVRTGLKGFLCCSGPTPFLL